MNTSIRIWLRLRAAKIHPTNPVHTRRYCAASSVHGSGAPTWRETTPATTLAKSENNSSDAATRSASGSKNT